MHQKGCKLIFLYIFGVKPIKYVIMSENDEREFTLGENRVRLTFNPSQDDKVGQFKKKVADLIDEMNNASYLSPDGETKRCFAMAMTELESAAHWGVKGLTAGK